MGKKLLIGLTGGVGCGKSFALNAFRLLGCDTLDADKICHDLYNEPDGVLVSAIRARWGEKVIKSNAVDKKAIAEIVFNDESEREWLNQLIHPMVFDIADKITQKSKNVVIFDVPLLFEAGWEKHFAKIITVWTTASLQQKRLKQRNWTDEETTSRINAQIANDIKLEKADFGIINIGDRDFLFKQCKNILSKVIINYGNRNEEQRRNC